MSITFELLANLNGQALAAPGLDRAAKSTAGALQVDHRLCILRPLALQGLQPPQPIGLHRVVGGQLDSKVLRATVNPRLGGFVGIEKLIVTTEQETTHAGFQIHGQLDRFIALLTTRSVYSTHWMVDSR